MIAVDRSIEQRDQAETARWEAIRLREQAEAARWHAVRQRETAEAERATALAARDGAEAARSEDLRRREAAEAERVEALAARDAAEAARWNAVREFETAGAERVAALAARDAAEAARWDAVRKRETADAERLAALAARDAAEVARWDAVRQREAAEADRAEALAARDAAETGRWEAVREREAAEADRAEALAARDAAETARWSAVRAREIADGQLATLSSALDNAEAARWNAVREREIADSQLAAALAELEAAEAARWDPVQHREILETQLTAVLAPRAASADLVSSYDLVHLHEVYLFVPTADNLYDKFIPNDFKRTKLQQCWPSLHKPVFPPFEDLANDVSKAMLLYLDVLFRSTLSVYFVDIGAWAGDLSIRYASFAKSRRANFFANCIDPSDAASLIPRNIALNELKGLVGYQPLAISLSGQPLIFDQIAENSDSSRLESINESDLRSTKYVVDTLTLSECIPPNIAGQHIIVKIDVEGLEAKLILQNFDNLGHVTLIVEFSPAQQQYKDHSPETFIGTLRTTHSLFDVYYLPNPSRAAPIDDIPSFVQSVKKRPYGYTDVLAIPRSLPVHDEVVQRLQDLAWTKPSYNLT